MSINQYLKPAQDGTPVLRDYRHAARIFTDDQFRLSPKYGFLFYVQFEFNNNISNVTNTSMQELGMIVKSATLPKFNIDTKTHNAYNRVNIVQNKIKYDPVNIVFHDDQADNVRNFWYDYYSFFFRDSDYAESTYGNAHKYQSRSSFDWGYSPRPTVGLTEQYQPYQYIKSIRIFSLYQKNFSEYQLINPVITNFRHGDHVNGDNTLLQHDMTVQFETVKYLTGYTTSNSAYVDLHYDTVPSPLAGPLGTELIPNGQGGFSQVTDTVTDLANNNVLNGEDLLTTLTPFGTTSLNINSFAGQLSSSIFAAGSSGTNIAGFNIPSLTGSIAVGITNTAQLGQQLQAQAVNIAGGIVNSAANGLVGGLTAGLGQNGGAIVNLAAAAIANPQALVATATNMAATYAMQQVGSFASDLAQKGINEASGWIKDQVGSLVTDVSKSFGDISFGSLFSSAGPDFDTLGISSFGELNDIF